MVKIKCFYCKEKVRGFLKFEHDECIEERKKFVLELKDILSKCEKNKTLNEIIEKVESNTNYQNYLSIGLYQRNQIKENETLIFVEPYFYVTEFKNTCKMVEEWFSYAKYPVWKLDNSLLGNDLSIAFTDKSFYLFQDKNKFVYSYKKIMSLDFDVDKRCIIINLKTSSPYPRVLTINSADHFNNENIELAYFYLKCFSSMKGK